MIERLILLKKKYPSKYKSSSSFDDNRIMPDPETGYLNLLPKL